MCSVSDTTRLERWRVRKGGCVGQATIEAAFALPILMVMVLLLIQPSIILYDRIVMQNAAAEGCRLLATSTSADQALCEDYVRRRLSAVPQTDIFHVHSTGCSWDIALMGDETADRVKVSIDTRVQPLPLIGAAAGLLGATQPDGTLVVHVECEEDTQPAWVHDAAGGASPEDWIGRWLA